MIVVGLAYPTPHRGSHKGVPLRGVTGVIGFSSAVSARC